MRGVVPGPGGGGGVLLNLGSGAQQTNELPSNAPAVSLQGLERRPLPSGGPGPHHRTPLQGPQAPGERPPGVPTPCRPRHQHTRTTTFLWPLQPQRPVYPSSLVILPPPPPPGKGVLRQSPLLSTLLSYQRKQLFQGGLGPCLLDVHGIKSQGFLSWLSRSPNIPGRMFPVPPMSKSSCDL